MEAEDNMDLHSRVLCFTDAAFPAKTWRLESGRGEGMSER